VRCPFLEKLFPAMIAIQSIVLPYHCTVKPKLPENFEEETWNKLQKAIRAVHTSSQLLGSSLEELYKVRSNPMSSCITWYLGVRRFVHAQDGLPVVY
jgi:hypothetical protein